MPSTPVYRTTANLLEQQLKAVLRLPYNIAQVSFRRFAGEDAADQGHYLRRGWRENNRLMKNLLRLGQKRGAGGVEGSQRLAFFEMRAAAGMEVDSGVGIDRLTGLFAARAGALHGPTEGGGGPGGDKSAQIGRASCR